MTAHHFRVTARTVLQLGAELISSDGVALYELVKNGIDAGSPTVHISFTIRIQPERWPALNAAFEKREGPHAFAAAKEHFLASIDHEVKGAQELDSAVVAAKNWDTLLRCFDAANELTVRDTGRGMTADTLIDAFLTIGTQVKLQERQARKRAGVTGPPILGEKGVGRLSAMRLGARLIVMTTASGDRFWNMLTIDWRRFDAMASEQLDQVPVELTRGAAKPEPTESGTTLRILGLKAPWSLPDAQQLATEYLARLADPFGKSKSPVRLHRNGDRITVPRLAAALLPSAHATVTARYELVGGVPRFTGTIDYALRAREGPIDLREEELLSITEAPLDVLRDLGPFELQFYWWNRGSLSPIDSIGDTVQVKKELDRWAGGVAVYRDGYRVAPYGSMNDDWLDLDRHAFRSRGYKLNRAQIIAKIDISRDANPHLIDQTNREGLQHTPEYVALRKLLKAVTESEIRPFLEEADEEARARDMEPIGAMKKQSRTIAARVKRSMQELRLKAPRAVDDSEIVVHVDALVKQLSSVMRNSERLIETSGHERERLTALAGIGLMVEVIAHELNRATENAVSTINDASRLNDPTRRKRALDLLSGELKTLQKRLSVLDELSISGRQRKTDVDLVDWVSAVIDDWGPKFQRHGIECMITVSPSGSAGRFRARVVKGMIVQVLGNLLANSTYWLMQRQRREPTLKPEIRVMLDAERRRITVIDNGPGVPDGRADLIFQPFVTTKPPGKGRGLGLFIAREIAKYHGGTLYLSDEPRVHPGRRNAFVFELGADASA